MLHCAKKKLIAESAKTDDNEKKVRPKKAMKQRPAAKSEKIKFSWKYMNFHN